MPVRIKNRVVQVTAEAILVESDGVSDNSLLFDVVPNDFFGDSINIKPGNEYRDGWLRINADSLDDLITSLQNMRKGMRTP